MLYAIKEKVSMRSRILFLIIFAPFFGIAQKEKRIPNVHESQPGLEVVNLIKWQHLKDGFSFGDGHVAYVFRLDSSHKFKYVESGCVGDITLDRGTWKIKDNKSLILKSKKHKYIFELIKFGNFLFYIMPSQRQDFVKDLENERKETAHYQIEKDDTRYTREFFMAFNLVRKYYVNELIQ